MIRHHSFHQRSSRHLAFVAVAAILVSTCRTSVAVAATAPDHRIEVSADQTTTVVGEFDSLKKLLDELCRAAHVELRSYDADDRALRVDYQRLPLATVLAGLLRRESYIVGVSQGSEPGATHVAWLRVTGGPPGIPLDPAAENPAEPPLAFEVPATFGDVAFGSEDPEQRARALEAVAKSLLTSESGARSLLAAEPAAIAAMLRGYPHAGALLRQLRDEQADPALRSKLDAVLAAIE